MEEKRLGTARLMKAERAPAECGRKVRELMSC